jgi:hypothetical protein
MIKLQIPWFKKNAKKWKLKKKKSSQLATAWKSA